MSAIASRLEHEHPESNAGRGVRVVSLFEKTVGSVRPALLVLLAAVGCLLLIACTNVANLLLARASGRQKEIAVRTALGAGRLRLIRQLVTEGTLLSLLGGAGGTLAAVWALELVRQLNPDTIPRLQEVQLDFRVLGIMHLVTLAAGVAAAVAPALMVTRADFFEGIREFGTSRENPRGRRFRTTLIRRRSCHGSGAVFASTGQPRFRTFLLGLFAALALTLAVVGVFGVISYSVSQQARDFGIRVALGAKPGDIIGLVLRRGFLTVGVGIVLGLACSLALTQFMSSLLFGITPHDASTFVLGALACSAAAFAACYFPSRRAMKVDPITVLRSE